MDEISVIALILALSEALIAQGIGLFVCSYFNLITINNLFFSAMICVLITAIVGTLTSMVGV